MSDTVPALGDTPLDDAAIDASTRHYSEARLTDDVALASAFVFRLGSEWFALATSLLVSVAAPPVVHSLPHRRGSAVAGLVNVGGDLVVHVSLAGLLGVPAGVTSSAGATGVRRSVARLVVLGDARGRLAITVDDVWGVHHHDPALLRVPPPTLTRSPSSFTTAILEVDGLVVACLDAARVMDALSSALS
ncbi:MAG: chemotaxis protein CheW [bacterium]